MSDITITDKAARRLSEIRTESKLLEDIPLRIGVVGGGCSGLTYKLDFDKELSNPENKDQYFEDKGIKMVVDMRSFLYLAGTELDYSDGLNGKGFHFKNPNATRTCSCGESFTV